MKSNLYEQLLLFVGTNRRIAHLVHKGDGGRETRIEIQKFWGKLKIIINHKGKEGDNLKDPVAGNLEALMGIPDLISQLRKVGEIVRCWGNTEDEFKYQCEVINYE